MSGYDLPIYNLLVVKQPESLTKSEALSSFLVNPESLGNQHPVFENSKNSCGNALPTVWSGVKTGGVRFCWFKVHSQMGECASVGSKCTPKWGSILRMIRCVWVVRGSLLLTIQDRFPNGGMYFERSGLHVLFVGIMLRMPRSVFPHLGVHFGASGVHFPVGELVFAGKTLERKNRSAGIQGKRF